MTRICARCNRFSLKDSPQASEGIGRCGLICGAAKAREWSSKYEVINPSI